MNSGGTQTAGGDTEGPDQSQQWVTYLQTGATLAAGAVGLTAYVYLLGGSIVWLRVYAARLPADIATVAFQDRALLAIGLKALLFELLLLGALALAVWAVRWVATRLDRGGRRPAELITYVIVTLLRSLIIGLTAISLLVRPFIHLFSGSDAALVLLVIVLVGLGIALVNIYEPPLLRSLRMAFARTRNPSRQWVADLVRFGLSVAVVFIAVVYMSVALGLTVIVLLVLLTIVEKSELRPYDGNLRDRVLTVLILAAALNLVIVPYLATPPVDFDHARVVTKKGEEIDGAYLGRSSEGVFLATCAQRVEKPHLSKEGRIEVIPAENVEEVVIGGFKYSFDVGNRPSLWALGRHLATGEDMHRDDDGFLLDLRQRPTVCGTKNPA